LYIVHVWRQSASARLQGSFWELRRYNVALTHFTSS